jgi:hypothetical protein
MNLVTHTLTDPLSESVASVLMKIGHSYLRWSTREQSKGDTYARQIEERDRCCLRRGITLISSY